MTFHPQVRPAKTALPSPALLLSSTVTTSARRTPALLAEELAGLAGDGDAERAQVLGEDAGVGVQIERPLALTHHRGEPAAGVDLADRAAGVHRLPHHGGGRRDGAVERRQVVVEEVVADVEVHGVDRQVEGAGNVQRLVEALRVDPELGREVAAVVADAALGAGGADAGVDAQADVPPRFRRP